VNAIGLHHVGFCVRDLDEAVVFYERFGFEAGDFIEASGPDAAIGNGLDEAHMTIRFMHRADVVLELTRHHLGGSPAPRPPGAVGHAYIALQVDDVQAAYDELRAAGVAFRDAPHYVPADEAWSATALDPSGIPVVLTQFGAVA